MATEPNDRGGGLKYAKVAATWTCVEVVKLQLLEACPSSLRLGREAS